MLQPDISGDAPKKEFYVREVNVDASAPNPLIEVDFKKSRVDSEQRLLLTEKHVLVYDPDTQDADGNVDASSVWLRITGLTGGELQRRSSSSASDWTKIVAGGKAYLEFTLAQLRAGRIAFLSGEDWPPETARRSSFRFRLRMTRRT